MVSELNYCNAILTDNNNTPHFRGRKKLSAHLQQYVSSCNLIFTNFALFSIWQFHAASFISGLHLANTFFLWAESMISVLLPPRDSVESLSSYRIPESSRGSFSVSSHIFLLSDATCKDEELSFNKNQGNLRSQSPSQHELTSQFAQLS